MKSAWQRWAGLFSLMALLGLLPGLSWPGRALSQENEAEKLKRGDILISFHPSPRSGLSEVTGIILFDAPLALVWKVITDYPDYARFLPNFTLSQVARQEGLASWVKVQVRNPWPSPDFNYSLKFTAHADLHELEFNLEEGNVKALYGRWKLEPFAPNPKQTKATYTLLQDPGYLLALTQNLSNRSLVLEQLDAYNAEIKLEKQRQEGEPGQVIRPKWRKALPWWEDREPVPSKPKPKPAPAKP